jgi:hypothetical protein
MPRAPGSARRLVPRGWAAPPSPSTELELIPVSLVPLGRVIVAEAEAEADAASPPEVG